MTALTTPRVSIIIITYNSETYIEQCLESALAQTYSSKEIIVIDDGSTDNTRQILEPFMEQIHYHYQENAGIPTARNKGLGLAQGEFINYLDSDDYFIYPEKIAEQVNILDANLHYGVVYGAYQHVDLKGNVINIIEPWTVLEPQTIEHLVDHWFLLLAACLFRKSWFDRVGGFDTQYTRLEDTQIGFRMICHGLKICWHYQVVYAYRIRTQARKSYNIERFIAQELIQMTEELFKNGTFPDSVQKKKHQTMYYKYQWVATLVGRTAQFEDLKTYIQGMIENCPNYLDSSMIGYSVLSAIKYEAQLNGVPIIDKNQLIHTLQNMELMQSTLPEDIDSLQFLQWWLDIWWLYFHLDIAHALNEFFTKERATIRLELEKIRDKPIRQIVKLAQNSIIRTTASPEVHGTNRVTIFWEDVMSTRPVHEKFNVITLYLTEMTRCMFARRWKPARHALIHAIRSSGGIGAISPWGRFLRSMLQFGVSKVSQWKSR
jgi:glycosyltransferase involved in cell wall biosynthesis